MTSSRLPGKVLLPLYDKPVLLHIIERLRQSRHIDDVVVATTKNDEDNPIISLCDECNCSYYRGSEDDVLSRVLEAANEYKADIIVEITADCVFVNGVLADFTIERMIADKTEYASNVINRTFPRGFDLQVFYTKTLERLSKLIDNPIDRQHVSTILYKHPMRLLKENCITKSIIKADSEGNDYSNIRLTLDTKEDYKLINLIFNIFKGNNNFTVSDILYMTKEMPEMFEINRHIQQKNYYEELANFYVEQKQGDKC
jgi:spore coat polysaccharide biosynthesis protein SpsF